MVNGSLAQRRSSGHFHGDIEAAFRCFDAWSACSTKYPGSHAARDKFDEMTADYEGRPPRLRLICCTGGQGAAPRRSSVPYIRRGQRPLHLTAQLPRDTDAATIWPKGAEPIPPNTLSAEDGIVALEYLLHCWSEKACQSILAAYEIPQEALDEAQRRNDQRRETIELAGRILHRWDGKDLAADTAALADAIVAANPRLYRIDNTLVRISAPVTDPATAARVRKLHNYKGRPGDVGDPALHAGERLVPILPSDTEALARDHCRAYRNQAPYQ